MESAPPVIEAVDLHKVFPDGTAALQGVSVHAGPGEFFGFLGPNGAGKTTTIKILTTLLEPTSGVGTVLGLDVRQHADEIRRRIGYAAQETGIDDELSGRENLDLQGRLYHLAKEPRARRVSELLELLDLTNDADRPAGSYSGGMRKRLDLGTGLIHRPEVLFLDEPTTGLDPQTRASLWQYLERLNREEGLTIFLTTHYMEEADRLCDRLAIIDHGRTLVEGRPADLKAELGGDVIAVRFKSNGSAAEEGPRAAKSLEGLPAVRRTNLLEHGINVIVHDGGTAVPIVLHALKDAGLAVDGLSLMRPTLDDVFLKYTGHSIRQEEGNPNWRSSRNPFFGRRRIMG